jgi:phosphatidylglycerol lysyltransferase
MKPDSESRHLAMADTDGREPPAGRASVRGIDTVVLEEETRGAGGLSRLRKLANHIDWSKVGALIAFVLFTGVAYVLYNELQDVTWAHVREAANAIGWDDIAGAGVATALSYIALIGYDLVALREVGARNVPLRLTAVTSFISQAFTFTLGFGVLTGSAVRMRLYRLAGLTTDQVLNVGALCAMTFWVGLAAVAGICLVTVPSMFAAVTGYDKSVVVGIGAAILALLAGWVLFTALRPREVGIHGWTLKLPGPQTTLKSIVVGVCDTTAAALALWLLLPDSADITFPGFLSVFAFATALGVVSHVPGGFGVFDTAILLSLPQVPEPAMLASLLVFRLIYYIAPLALATGAMALTELTTKSTATHKGARAIADAAAPFLPGVAAVAVFLGGFVLVTSGALPAEADRMAVLRRIVPLPFVETSHFIASIVGALLLVVAHGLLQRLKSAWNAAVVLVAAGAVFSLLKGFDYEEALICLAVLGVLFVGRRGFYRQGGLLSSSRRPAAELLAIAVAIAASVWIGLYVYRNIEYDNSLWWDFAFRGDAPRFLRASLGIAITGLILVLYQTLHRSPPMRAPGSPEDVARAQGIVAASERVEANLAQLGDKRFLFSGKGDGFVMYGVQGSSWVAMGDPISLSPEGVIDLVWKFKELVDEHRGVPVFYQVTSPLLPIYLDAGFSLVKLGEEAWVNLDTFTLEGGEGRKLRQLKAKALRSGSELEIVPAAGVAPLLPELRAVSDAWLAARDTKEKGFSLGFWSEPYIVKHDLAVIRHDGRIVAFANIWTTGKKLEYSVDLMRHLPDAPAGIMDLLFIGLMERAKADGYKWFNLGMAPLSGLPQHRLASHWSRLGAFFFRHADRLYNFEGLRAFKTKFKPEWRPKYLAYPGGLLLPQVLIDVTTLIASSPKRVTRKADAGDI